MLRPKPMVRVLLAGPRDQMPATIEVLYDLKLLHVMEHQEEDEVFGRGRPLERAEEVSENLVKLRSIASVLGLEETERPPEAEVGPDVRQRIAALEVNIREEEASRERIEELLRELIARVEALRPFAALGLDLSYYGGYENLAFFVGRLTGSLAGLEEITEDYERFQEEDTLALFVPRQKAGELRDLLAQKGFTPLEVPEEEGDPRSLLQEALDERAKWEGRLEEVRQRLSTLRERYADFVVSAEAFLSREIEKAEAPLMFAASDHSFVAEGWVPADAWEGLRARLGEIEGLYVDLTERGGGEPPVLLNNPRPVRSFELLTNLFSTPSYEEIDPTITLFLIFPLFFGLMVGDLGYGVVLALIGAVGVLKTRRNPPMRMFLAIVLVAGVATALIGAFVYADAFGIPFHPAEEGGAHAVAPLAEEAEAAGELSWETFGVDVPFHASIHKLTDIGDLLILSIVAAFLHLGLGFILGFFNEVHHDKRHAVGKLAWFGVLLGLFLTILAQVRWNRIAGYVLETFFAPIPLAGASLFGFDVPLVALGLLVGGGLVMAVMEFLTIGNPVAILEVASLLANMISYTRLAGIAVAKAAIAESLNGAIFEGLIFQGNLGLVAFGFFLLVGAQLIVLLLGGLSSGIQALRLNYVEFFMKFFKGEGVPFRPFGVQSTETT